MYFNFFHFIEFCRKAIKENLTSMQLLELKVCKLNEAGVALSGNMNRLKIKNTFKSNINAVCNMVVLYKKLYWILLELETIFHYVMLCYVILCGIATEYLSLAK